MPRKFRNYQEEYDILQAKKLLGIVDNNEICKEIHNFWNAQLYSESEVKDILERIERQDTMTEIKETIKNIRKDYGL